MLNTERGEVNTGEQKGVRFQVSLAMTQEKTHVLGLSLLFLITLPGTLYLF